MNVSILKDKQYDQETKQFLIFWTKEKESYTLLEEWWEEMKRRIKAITIKHSVRIARTRKKEKERILKELNKLQQETTPDKGKIEEMEGVVKDLLNREQEGLQIRSRARWIEKGEKPTRFFYGLEKSRQKKNTIKSLKTDKGTVTTNTEILIEARSFYQNLYMAQDTDKDDQHWLIENLDKTLSDLDKESCEGPMTTIETTKAVKEMNNNKSPGPDGIPAEFYKQYWELLTQNITELFNHNYDVETMTESQREALLKLLYKKNDLELLKNWRPISLLNADYKIAAKVSATRLKNVLPQIVHVDQTCGVPGRTIYENLFKIRDIVHQAHRNKSNVIVISLDQEKAFDRVDREFLKKTLDKMNFGPSFKHWISTMYNEAQCTIENNGWLSDPVQLHRGLRQGCPLSPLLYILVAESLGQIIRKADNIQGIPIPGGNGETAKITQYADDATLTLRDDMSVQRCFDIVTRYERGSGSKLNYEKTEGIYIGKQEGRQHGAVPITWKNDFLEILGAQIGPSLEQDWRKPLGKLNRRLQGWSSRSLSIYGRALITRTFGLANFIFQPPFS